MSTFFTTCWFSLSLFTQVHDCQNVLSFAETSKQLKTDFFPIINFLGHNWKNSQRDHYILLIQDALAPCVRSDNKQILIPIALFTEGYRTSRKECFTFLSFKFLKMFNFEKERACALGGGGAERGGQDDPKQAPCWHQRARCGAWTKVRHLANWAIQAPQECFTVLKLVLFITTIDN